MKRIPIVVIALLFIGCKQSNTDIKKTLSVIATTGMVADTIQNIGGKYVQVQTLMGPGVDPHTYKTTPGDIQKIQLSNLIAYNGLHLEGKMADVLDKIALKKPVIAFGKLIPKEKILNAKGQPDPHIWMDPSLWVQTFPEIAKKLGELDPQHTEIYRKNAINYGKKLMQMHQRNLINLQKIPITRRVLITAHDAFRYFGRAYQIEVKGIQGISTESEAGLKEINGLVNLIVQKKIPAVFFESSVSHRSIQSLLEGTKNMGFATRIGGELLSDSMGESNTPQGTYLGMIQHNVKTIQEALK